MKDLLDNIFASEDELLPVIVQDYSTNEVLMLAYVNRQALEISLETGKAHFFSRKRKRIWMKGEESGNVLDIKEVFIDCDSDTILFKVNPAGPVCHTGAKSCFYRKVNVSEEGMSFEEVYGKKDVYGISAGILERVYEVIIDRKRHKQRKDSYTAKLFREGLEKILKKVGEEATEVVIAGANADKDSIVYEIADLIYHLLVLMAYYDIAPNDIFAELKNRFGKSGLRK